MHVAFSGNLTEDPELRHTKTGVAVVDLRVAENRSWKDQAGEWQTEVSFYTATVWRDLAEHAAESLAKGDRVMVTGRLRQEEWTGEDGTKKRRPVVDVVDLGASIRYATATLARVNGADSDPSYGDDDPERPF